MFFCLKDNFSNIVTKIILTILAISIISCSNEISKKTNIVLNYSQKNDFKNQSAHPRIIVKDLRNNKNIIGVKSYSEKKLNITNNQDLEKVIKNYVTQNLFDIDTNLDSKKTLEIHLLSLKYNTKRKFFIGESESRISIKAIINSNNQKLKSFKTIDLRQNNKHFILSLDTTDQNNINFILKIAIDDIFKDKKFISKLSTNL